MKFISTTGREYKVDLRPSRWPRRPKEECKSSLQWGVSQILSELYPNDIIFEEFFIPGDCLYIDFFVPRRGIAIEVHGRQHYEYSEFFHGSKASFLKHQKRDSRKESWCKTNNIDLVVIKYNEKEDSIRSRLKIDKH